MIYAFVEDYVVKGHVEMVVVIDPIGDHTLHRADRRGAEWVDGLRHMQLASVGVPAYYPTSEAVYTCVNV